MDQIILSRIDCVAAIGVTPEERTMKQRLSIDVELPIDASRAALHDSLKDTMDYSKVAHAVEDVCSSQDFHLIETVADRIARRILAEFSTSRVRVLVRKISPVLQPRVEHVSIEVIRTPELS